MKLTRRDFTAGVAAGISAPFLIGSARAQAVTTKIGMCVPVTGPAAEQGLGRERGQACARSGQQGRWRPRQARRIGHRRRPDHQSGHRARFFQARRAAGYHRISGLDPFDPVHAMAPDVLKLGKPVMIGGTDPALTHMGNPWRLVFARMTATPGA